MSILRKLGKAALAPAIVRRIWGVKSLLLLFNQEQVCGSAFLNARNLRPAFPAHPMLLRDATGFKLEKKKERFCILQGPLFQESVV